MSIDVNWNSQGFLHNTHVNRFSVCKGSQWVVLEATHDIVYELKGPPCACRVSNGDEFGK